MASVLNPNIDERVKNMDITKDEMHRIHTALKDEEFRKLFVSYAEEISNPENRKLYEDEISQMESQRGMDVKFVNPTPGYVLKTSVDGKTKAFINICINENIAKPTSKRETKGMNWQIPYSFSPLREDFDKKGKPCKVFDFIIHPDTLRLSESNRKFQSMIHETCCDGIKSSFSLQVDRSNLKRINLKFKGVVTSTVIRTEKKNYQKPEASADDDITSKFPYPYKEGVTSTNSTPTPTSPETAKVYASPTYTITHQSSFDIQSAAIKFSSSTASRPTHLVIAVDLPLLKSVASVDLDILERELKLKSDVIGARYKLNIPLPYAVNEGEGSAKFDKKKHKLIVTLPVMPQTIDEMPKIVEESNVEIISSSEHVEQPSCHSSDLTEVIDHDKGQDNGYDSDDICNSPFELSVFPLHSGEGFLPLRFCEHDLEDCGDGLVYVARVKRIARRSVRIASDGNSRLQISFDSMGDGCFAQHYFLCIEFVYNEEISGNENKSFIKDFDIDINNASMVVKLPKNRLGVRGQLKSYRLGLNFDDMKLCEVSSEENVENLIDSLLKTTEEKEIPSINVTHIDKQKLVIEIASTKSKRLVEQSSIESSSDGCPQLHGILRQRSLTMSEPYDIGLFTSTTEGDDTSCEAAQKRNRRRTVSFSEYVDSASFRNNETVATMHNSLKNRRRNKRRRDQRKVNREERNKQSDCSDHENSKKNGKVGSQKKRKGRKRVVQSENSQSLDSNASDGKSITSDSNPEMNSKLNCEANLEHSLEIKPKSNDEVETMLSWQDQEEISTPCPPIPGCTFQFENTQIFELDE